MHAMTMTAPRAPGLAKLGKFSAIIAIHAGLFTLLQTGMLRDAVHAVLPQVVTVSFVPPPPPPPSAPSKTVPLLQPAPAITPPPLPLLNLTVDNTITLPPAQPRSNDTASVPAGAQQQSAAAPPAPPAAPKLVQGVEYVRPPAPVYPAISRRLGESGLVMLRVLISEKGLPEQASIQKSSGSGNLDEAGRSAAMRTVFKPYMEDGKPVAVYVLVPINFQLS